MNLAAKVAIGITVTIAALGILGYLGLKIRPRPFPPHPAPTPKLKMADLPPGLPAPVERYYRTTIGASVPLIDTAVLSGRARLVFNGLAFQSRWRFTHQAGQDYRHYIEATFFGRPLMKVNEHYLDGQARLELPVGLVENEPKVDAAANLSLWGESMFFPPILVTDPRVRWEPVDDSHARLIVPYGTEEDSFTVAFDPGTGLIQSMEAMRWKDAKSEAKTLWVLTPRSWKRVHGMLLVSDFAVAWADDQEPWLVGTTEEMVFNADVGEYIRATGP